MNTESPADNGATRVTAKLGQKFDALEVKQRLERRTEKTPPPDMDAAAFAALRAQARAWWLLITDKDLAATGGHSAAIIHLLEDRYAYTYDQARAEYLARIPIAESP